MSSQIKTKKRVQDYGEVFTAEREVNAMLDLVKTEAERIDSKFLEPACGNGNFLIEILKRKLNACDILDFEKQSMISVASIYGIDLQWDNVEESKQRMFELWESAYKDKCNREASAEVKHIVKSILDCNIVCGNFLTKMRANKYGKEINRCIVFSDWKFVGNKIFQNDCRLRDMEEL